MGIRHLLSYARAHLMRNVVFDLKKPKQVVVTEGNVEKKQIIILDVLCLLRRYFCGNFLIDFEFMRQRVKQDVDAFRRAGFEIIVAIDGGKDEDELEPWFTRREHNLKELKIINEFLKNTNTRCVIQENVWRPVLSVPTYLGEAFEEAGCHVHYSKHKVDAEAVWYAIKNDAYGICSMDSDFLAYPKVKRFLLGDTLLIDNEQIKISMIENSLLIRYLGLNETNMAAIAGILGNDKLPSQNLEVLCLKWRNPWKPEAAAYEINLKKAIYYMSECRTAINYYKPQEPMEFKDKNESLLQYKIRLCKTVFGGIALENKALKSCHEILAPLRKSAYAKLKEYKVTEYICYPNVPSKEWRNPVVIETDKDTPIFPDPYKNIANSVLSICTYLYLTKGIDDFYFKIIYRHVKNRKSLKKKIKDLKILKPRLDDVHVASLYLQACELFWLGSKYPMPKCWDLFDGKLFFYLCQNIENEECEKLNIKMPVITAELENKWSKIITLI